MTPQSPTLSDASTLTMSSFSSLPSTPPPPVVMVPDDEPDSSQRRLLKQFEKIDDWRPECRAAKKHEETGAKLKRFFQNAMAQSHLSPPCNNPRINDVLDCPLMGVALGKKSPRPTCFTPKKSPGARIRAAIALAVSSEQKHRTYLVKPPSKSKQTKTPPKKPLWRRSPRMLQQVLAQHKEAGKEAELRSARWAAAVQSNLEARTARPSANASPRKDKRNVSWAAPGAQGREQGDALDQFMQLPAMAPKEPRASNLAELCRARRREVLLEMAVDADELPAALRGYAPRGQPADSLDAFLSVQP